MTAWLLVAHIAVVGYWLGSELVINAGYRFVCFTTDVPLSVRTRWMAFVMQADQHVRYALILQLTLGCLLAIRYGLIPGGDNSLVIVSMIGVAWLAFVEAVHRTQGSELGIKLARVDRGSRYLLLVLLIAASIGAIGTSWPMPVWLRWKLGLFAGVIACGVGIRLALIVHFREWARMQKEGADMQGDALVQKTYWRATSILISLWLLIGAIVYLSVTKVVP